MTPAGLLDDECAARPHIGHGTSTNVPINANGSIAKPAKATHLRVVVEVMLRLAPGIKSIVAANCPAAPIC